MATNPNAPSTGRQGTMAKTSTAQAVSVKKDIMEDGSHSFSVQVRVHGDQSDQAAIPDENLQQVRCATDPTNKGGTPYIKPGMQLRVSDYGGSPGSFGMGPYITSVDSFRSIAPTSSAFLVASDVAEPTVESDQYPYSKYGQSKDPYKNTTTEASSQQDCWVQDVDQDPKEKAKVRQNPWKKTGARYDN